jgi:hypothetical protein
VCVFFLPANAPMRRQKKEERKEQRKRKAKIRIRYLYANCKPNKEKEHQTTGARNTKKRTSKREPHKTVQKAVCAFVSPIKLVEYALFLDFFCFFLFSFFFLSTHCCCCCCCFRLLSAILGVWVCWDEFQQILVRH